MTQTTTPTLFQRLLLPGFAFKAVVIGGGYATGRELAEFFIPSGPWGGLAAIAVATIIWSAVTTVTFLFARATGTRDYRSFFRELLGPAAILFEIAYVLFVILILAVFGAAAGALGAAMLGWPPLVGTLTLMAGIALFATFGNHAVEQLFKYVSFLLYGVYAIFFVLALSTLGDRIATNFAAPAPTDGWFGNGVTYAGYNIIGAVVILPIVRHFTSNRDAVIAGMIAGPLAMIPALAFFICMIAFYPEIGGETLPSDFLLGKLGMPVFHFFFQLMIFSALLESGTGLVHAINERIATAWHERRSKTLSKPARAGISLTLLVGCIFIADHFGLVTLIANGYRILAFVFLAIYVLPLMTYGIVLLRRRWAQQSVENA